MGISQEPANSDQVTEATAREIIEYLLAHPNVPKRQLTAIKCKIWKKYRFQSVIKDSTIASYATEEERRELSHILRRRMTRTLSGVTVVAVMTAPSPAGASSCPGNCIFCPSTESQPGKKVARSYTGREPAAMRSAMYNYDSYEQTLNRLIDLRDIGHHVDKIELIIMGGTFVYAPEAYQDEFMKGCFDAILNFSISNYNDHTKTPDLATAKALLENSGIRLIGITFETRPDYCFEPHIDRMLELGITRIEIGIQSTREDILLFVNRKHTVTDSQRAIQAAKDAGLKVNAHMMPNLPKSSPAADIEDFRELFRNPAYRPDMLKIYPTLVIEGTPLFAMFQRGEYTPYSQEEVVDVIATVKAEIPPYVRIQRIQRDIPKDLIVAGVQNSNLRELVQERLRQRGTQCHCIRCREEGFLAHANGQIKNAVDLSSVQFYQMEYEASGGMEYFLSFEDKARGMLVGFLRLRLPSVTAHRPEIAGQKAAIVREIRVVGEIVGHDYAPRSSQIQHRGYGKELMRRAELISRELGREKVLVIAGIGVRTYFYALGYVIDGPYVSKSLI